MARVGGRLYSTAACITLFLFGRKITQIRKSRRPNQHRSCSFFSFNGFGPKQSVFAKLMVFTTIFLLK